MWTLGGDLVYSLSAHTSFVYAVSTLPDGNAVSSGEDRTVRVWKGKQNKTLKASSHCFADAIASKMANVPKRLSIPQSLCGLYLQCQTVTL
jgi:WD40 repeat protein